MHEPSDARNSIREMSYNWVIALPKVVSTCQMQRTSSKAISAKFMWEVI